MIRTSDMNEGVGVGFEDFCHDTLAIGEQETGKEAEEGKDEAYPENDRHAGTGVNKVVFYLVRNKIRVGGILNNGKSLGKVLDFVHSGVILLEIGKGEIVKGMGNVE